MTSPHRTAAFLDRDGVINVDRAYVHRWEDFTFVDGAVAAMRRLHEAGYALVVVTNQSGIARGYFDEAQFRQLSVRMVDALATAGVPGVAVYHCPHHPAGKVASLAVECDCRKPAPGMILRAAREHGLSLADSFLVGDKPSDIEAARAPDAAGADAVYADLHACVDALLGAPASQGAH